MAAAPPWQCLLDTGTWLEPRLSPVVTLDNLTAGECCSACIQAQHCATFELSAGRCHLSGNRSVSAAGTEPTRGVVLTVSYERAASPATRLPRLRRRRRRLLQMPCLTWAPFRLGALYSSCAPQDSTARRCTDFLGAARRAACMTPQLPPARLAMQECGGRRPIALRIAQANACYKVENTPDMAWVLAQPQVAVADWPRLPGDRGRLAPDLAPNEATGEPAGRRLRNLDFDTGLLSGLRVAMPV